MGKSWVDWFHPPKPVKPKPKYPIGRAGNYAAEVDTAGMDEEMKKSLGIGKKVPKKR